MKVWIVFGQTGAYSDKREWPVKGFSDMKRAETFEFECTKAAKAYEKKKDARSHSNEYQNWEEEEAELKAAVPGDPHFRCSYTGTDYYTLEVEIEP